MLYALYFCSGFLDNILWLVYNFYGFFENFVYNFYGFLDNFVYILYGFFDNFVYNFYGFFCFAFYPEAPKTLLHVCRGGDGGGGEGGVSKSLLGQLAAVKNTIVAH